MLDSICPTGNVASNLNKQHFPLYKQYNFKKDFSTQPKFCFHNKGLYEHNGPFKSYKQRWVHSNVSRGCPLAGQLAYGVTKSGPSHEQAWAVKGLRTHPFISCIFLIIQGRNTSTDLLNVIFRCAY